MEEQHHQQNFVIKSEHGGQILEHTQQGAGLTGLLQGNMIYMVNMPGQLPALTENSTILIQDPITKTYQLARITSTSTNDQEWSYPSTTAYTSTPASTQSNYVIKEEVKPVVDNSWQNYAFDASGQIVLASSNFSNNGNTLPVTDDGFGMEVVINTEPEVLTGDLDFSHDEQGSSSSITNAKKMQCDVCLKVLCNRDSLRRHKRVVHSMDLNGSPVPGSGPVTTTHLPKIQRFKKIYKCDICDKVLCNNDSVRRHKKVVHKSQNLASNSTSTDLYSPVIPQHQQQVEVQIQPQHQQPVEVQIQNQPQQPVFTKAKKKKAQCDICNKLMYNRATVFRHKANMHIPDFRAVSPSPPKPPPPPVVEKKNSIVCDICNRKFSDIGKLEKHKYTVHKLSYGLQHKAKSSKSKACYICGKVLYDKGVLQRHIKNIHKIDPNPNMLDIRQPESDPLATTLPSKRKYKPRSQICNICDRALYDKACLRRHMKTIHKIEIVDMPSSSPIPISAEAQALLNETLSSLHSQSSSTSENTSTDVVGNNVEVVSTPADVKQEPKSPRKEKPHKCDQCQDTFVNSSNLRRHLVLVHKLELPNSESVIRSYKTHSVLPQKCEICDRTIIGRSNLVRHQRLVHKIEPQGNAAGTFYNSNSNSASLDGEVGEVEEEQDMQMISENNINVEEFAQGQDESANIFNADNGVLEVKSEYNYTDAAFSCLTTTTAGTGVELQEVEKAMLGGVKNEVFELTEVEECVAEIKGKVATPEMHNGDGDTK